MIQVVILCECGAAMHWGLLDRSSTDSERIASPARTDNPSQRKWLGYSRQERRWNEFRRGSALGPSRTWEVTPELMSERKRVRSCMETGKPTGRANGQRRLTLGGVAVRLGYSSPQRPK